MRRLFFVASLFAVSVVHAAPPAPKGGAGSSTPPQFSLKPAGKALDKVNSMMLAP